MAVINKPSQPLIPPTDVEEVEEIAANAAEAAIAADDTHAPLVDDKVPAEHLPSYVDDVLNFDSVEAFPEEGEEGKIYVANDTNLTYRWSGAAYIQVGGASLAAGDGIEIENDIVSVDMMYVDKNLDHVTTDEFNVTINELFTELDKKATNFICHVTFDPNTLEDPSDPYTGTLTQEEYNNLMDDPAHAIIIANDLGRNVSYVLSEVTIMPGEDVNIPMFGSVIPGIGTVALGLRGPTWTALISEDEILSADQAQSMIDAAVAPKANSVDVEAALNEKASNFTCHVTLNPSTLEDHRYHGEFTSEEYTKLTADPVHAIIIAGDVERGQTYFLSEIGIESDEENESPLYGAIVPGVGAITLGVYSNHNWSAIISENAVISADQAQSMINAAVAPKANSADVEAALGEKQDTLVSGTNIKTINNQSVLGEGNLEINGFDGTVMAEIDAETGVTLVYIPENKGLYKIHNEENGHSGWIVFAYPDWIACYDYKLTYGNYDEYQPGDTMSLDGDGYFVADADFKTINGESIIGSDDIKVSSFNDIYSDWNTEGWQSKTKQEFLNGQDIDIVDRALWSSITEIGDEGTTASKPSKFSDAIGNKYTLIAITENSADVFIEWNRDLLWKSDAVDNGLGQEPIEKWHIEPDQDTETASYKWTYISGTRYATMANLADKQDTLVSATNIKTINGQSILGSGNLEVGGNDIPLLTLTPTGVDEHEMPIGSLTDEQIAVLSEIPLEVKLVMGGSTPMLMTFVSQVENDQGTITDINYGTVAELVSITMKFDLVNKSWSFTLTQLAKDEDVKQASAIIEATYLALMSHSPLPEVDGQLDGEQFIPLDTKSWSETWEKEPTEVLLHLRIHTTGNDYVSVGDYILMRHRTANNKGMEYFSQITADGCQLIINQPSISELNMSYQWIVPSICCTLPVPDNPAGGLYATCEIQDLDSVSVARVPE